MVDRSTARILETQRVQDLNAERLYELPNVIGLGTGFPQTGGEFKTTRGPVVQVFVQRKYPDAELPDWARIPRELPGIDRARISVDVVEVGFVYAAQDTTRYRPVPGGCSIGHQNAVDASTLGGWACDLTDDSIVLLSCNHCIAGLNVASVPGGIVQPGRLDGGVVPADLIGALKRFIPININPNPPVTPVDAAVGTITVQRDDDVLNIGPAIYELGTPALGMTVQKRGRTTQYTNNGTITSVNVQVNVNYGTVAAPVIGRIGNSFIVTSTDGNAFANRGDSGSLIFDTNQGTLNSTFPVLGMFFAVSNNGVTTWHNDINTIFAQLNLSTVCACALRAIINAIFGIDEASSGSAGAAKAAELREFRDTVMPSTPFGSELGKLLLPEVGILSKAINEDPIIFGLAVRTFGPLVRQRSMADLLDAEVDTELVSNFRDLADRIGRKAPALRSKLRSVSVAMRAVEGATVGQLLEAATLDVKKG